MCPIFEIDGFCRQGHLQMGMMVLYIAVAHLLGGAAGHASSSASDCDFAGSVSAINNQI
jgi:hypothetical protein